MLASSLTGGFDRFIDYVRVHCSRCTARLDGKIYTDVFAAMNGAQKLKTGTAMWTRVELECETALLILAGSDTAATVITAALFYLAHNPLALKEAQRQVRQTFSNVEIRSGDSLSSCQYLRPCIHEKMRMSLSPYSRSDAARNPGRRHHS